MINRAAPSCNAADTRSKTRAKSIYDGKEGAGSREDGRGSP